MCDSNRLYSIMLLNIYYKDHHNKDSRGDLVLSYFVFIVLLFFLAMFTTEIGFTIVKMCLILFQANLNFRQMNIFILFFAT